MFFKVFKLTIIDYWWNGYRTLSTGMKRLNPTPIEWFFSTLKVLREKNGKEN